MSAQPPQGRTPPVPGSTALVAVLLLDTTTGQVVYANPAATALGGPAELPVAAAGWSRAAALRAPDGAASSWLSPVDRAAAGGTITGEAVLVAAGDGEPERSLWVTGFPMDPATELAGRTLVALVDTGTPAPGSVDDLHRRALASIDVSFTMADPHLPDRPLVWVNDAFTRVTGYDVRDAVGRNCRFLQGPGTDPAAVAELRAAQEQVRATTVVLLNYRRDGSAFWNEVSMAPVLSRTGELTHFVGVQTDVTARVGIHEERERLLQEERRARDRLEVLGRVTEVLSGTLDAGPALRELAQLLVPGLADLVSIDLLEDADGTRRIATAAVDPAEESAFLRAESERARVMNPRSSVGRVLRSGLPVLESDIDVDYIAAAAVSAQQRASYVELGLRSLVAVPMVARGRVVGVLSLIATARSGRRFGEDDVRLAADVGRRAGLLMDNTRLFLQERAVSEALQRSLLPALPVVPGMSFAAQYLPAGDTAQVGGDWYDVLPLPGGSVGIAIGDVMGHDLAAAAAMGQLRSVLRSYAWEGSGPGNVLDRLDRLVQGLDMAQLATAFYGVLLPAGDVGLAGAGTDLALFRYANAGHLPPLLRTPEGKVRRLDGAQSVLVGAAPVPPRVEARELLAPGSTLVLYTDGLVEHRGRDVEEGLDRLASVLASRTGVRVDDLADELVDEMIDRDTREDDSALLVVHLTG